MAKDRTKLVDKKVYAKWYNLAKETIKNEEIIPSRTNEEIFDIVSQENWLMFCQKDETRDVAIAKDEPNVFFDVLSREGNLEGTGRLGLTFNNLRSYERFKTIMRGLNKDVKNKISNKLTNLNNDWKINIQRKIKEFNYAQTPTYKLEKEWSSNQINDTIVDEIIKLGNNIREQGLNERDKRKPKYYFEGPSINLMEAEFPLKEEVFKDRVLEIFEVLSLCLNVKTDIEVNRALRTMVKRITELEILKKNKEEHLAKLKSLKDVPYFSKEDIAKQEKELEELKKELEDLKKKVEENK
ncbi:MAG: hypothetical protein WC781_03320 [Candidatus Pacearchaeota archaeon]